MKKVLLVVAVLMVTGCENPFSPRGPYVPRLVVYSVLSNTRSAQFVRVSMICNPPAVTTALPDSGLGGGDVRILSGGVLYSFRDTLLALEGTEGQIHAYVCDSLPVTHGASYGLQVSTQSLGSAGSTISIPTAPSVKKTDLNFTVGLSGNTRSYMVRFYVEFDTQTGPDTIRHRWEVPLFASDTTLSDAIYPGFRYADRSTVTQSFSQEGYYAVLTRIVHQYSILVKWRYMAIEVYQIGEPLQTYSSIVNGFKDELSLRADKPDYSNITGGLGLFGAYTQDEVLFAYPDNFFYNPDPVH